jgi:propanediol dehydratase small subunit
MDRKTNQSLLRANDTISKPYQASSYSNYVIRADQPIDGEWAHKSINQPLNV